MLDAPSGQALFIIPFYNEEERIDFTGFETIFEENPNLNFLLVDDCSTDQTYKFLNTFSQKYEHVRCIRNEENKGKAESIRLGVLTKYASSFKYIGYLDADLATPISEMIKLLDFAIANPNISIVMGARIKLLGNNVKRSVVRHYFGRLFATVISQCILKIPVYDTQCGAKIIKTELAKSLFSQVFFTRWLFDVELLLRYKKQDSSFLAKVVEIPLHFWEEKGNTKIKWYEFIGVPFQMIKLYVKY